MQTVILDGRAMTTREEFHRLSREAFGFPDYYGNNISAWIDCMSGLRDDDQMTRIVLAADEVLEIVVDSANILRAEAPEILQALQHAVNEVNLRCEEDGQAPALMLRLR